jgi:hypothetical protein
MNRVVVLLLLCGVAALVQPAAAQEMNGWRERVEYAVYSAVLDGIYGDADARAHLVADSTHGVLRFGPDQKDLIVSTMATIAGLPSGLIADYEAANRDPRVLREDRFSAGTTVRLLGGAVLREIVEATMDVDGYPEPLPARGHATFSRAGFSAGGSGRSSTSTFAVADGAGAVSWCSWSITANHGTCSGPCRS